MNSEIIVVLGAAVLNFCLTSLWFILIKKSDRNPSASLISFMGSIWASYGMFLMIKHIVPNSISELLGISIGAWVFILIALSAKHYAYAKVSLREFLKDYLVDLFGLTLTAWIIWSGV